MQKVIKLVAVLCGFGLTVAVAADICFRHSSTTGTDDTCSSVGGSCSFIVSDAIVNCQPCDYHSCGDTGEVLPNVYTCL